MKRFSVKRPGQWLWRTGYTRQQILDRWLEGRFEDDLLVCPLGDAHLATTLAEFRNDEQAHAKCKERYRLEVEAWEAEVRANTPAIRHIGLYLVALCVPVHLIFMVIAIVFDIITSPTSWPAWLYITLSITPTLGASGLLLAIAGLVQHRIKAFLLWRQRHKGQIFL